MRRIGLALGIGFMGMTVACGDCGGSPGIDEPLSGIQPQMQIFPRDGTDAICADEDIRDCEIDFGDVAIGEGRFVTFQIKNAGSSHLTIASIRVESADADPQFEVSEIVGVQFDPDNAEACEVMSSTGESVSEDTPRTVAEDIVLAENCDDVGITEVTVRFAPQFAASQGGQIIITSDAVNVDPELAADEDREGELRVDTIIDVVGNGLDLGQADCTVTPEQCNFGEIGVGTVSYCDVTIENTNARDCVIDVLELTDDTPKALNGSGGYDPTESGFGIQTLLFTPIFVAPGTSMTVRLFANPPDVQQMEGTLRIESNDVQNPELDVPLTVRGADVPTAIARIKSVNGVNVVVPNPVIKPLDDVVLTGVESQPSSLGAAIGSYTWTIDEVPIGLSLDAVALTDPNGVETGFEFESAQGTTAGVPVAGTYRVSLVVCDDNEPNPMCSTNSAEVVFAAVPQESFHIELTWDSPAYDYDLHVIRAGGPYCTQNSCFYANCNVNNPGIDPPEWDGVAGDTSGDPTLDIDDLSGYGPENINIDTPDEGVYRIAVHAYSANVSEPVIATVKIFINGGLAYETAREMANGNDFWEAAEVEWAGGAAIIYPIDELEPDWACFEF